MEAVQIGTIKNREDYAVLRYAYEGRVELSFDNIMKWFKVSLEIRKGEFVYLSTGHLTKEEITSEVINENLKKLTKKGWTFFGLNLHEDLVSN